jgi:polar amino acid transport system substrate-binding protein
MKRFLVALVLVVFTVTAFVGPAEAGEKAGTLDRIVANGELRVGMSGNQPPYNMKNKNGDLIGLEVDMAKLLAEAMNVKPVLVVKPFAQLIPALLAGEVDVVMSGMTITAERNMKVAFIGPYNISGKSILTKSATLAAAEQAADINEKDVTLTALEGSTSQKFVEILLPEAQLKKAADYDAAVKLLLEDQVNAMVADMEICQLTLLRNPGAGLATLSTPLTLEPIGIAVAPGDPLFINLMENYFSTLEVIGFLEELRIDWFENPAWLAQMP